MRRTWLIRILTAAAVMGLTVGATSADESGVSLRAKLSGFQEVPPKLSAGTGSLVATVSGGRLTYTLKYSGLSSPAFMAHLHFAQAGVNGGIFLWLCGSAAAPGPAGTPACPAAGGTVTRTVGASDIQAVPDQNLAAGDFAGALRSIQNHDVYANVHTTNFKAGEIRGQVRAEGDNSD